MRCNVGFLVLFLLGVPSPVLSGDADAADAVVNDGRLEPPLESGTKDGRREFPLELVLALERLRFFLQGIFSSVALKPTLKATAFAMAVSLIFSSVRSGR